MAEKNLYIISGCNGAGKTTASYSVLPKLLDCKQFVNADEIAKGLSPFCPESVAIQAGKLMLLRIEELLTADETFSIETTLATRSYSELVKRAQEKGYKVTLLYFWLSSPELAVERVARRVREGGHNIPKDVIYRRYEKGLKNLFNIFIPIVDSWMIVDNGVEPREIIAKGTKNEMKTFNDFKLDKIKNYGRQ
jgi:predicted ABC-type ATPase